MEEVAAGVFGYIQPDGGWCLNNAGIITSGGRSALIDSAATVARARALRDSAVAVAGRAPQWLVNTHFHGDHTFGNCVFADEAVIIAHERTREEVLAAGLHLQGLWPEVAWGEVTVAAPSVTFRDQLTLHVGDIRAELRYYGPAHTTNDTVVWLPDSSVLFTGDLVMAGVTPFCPMGSVSGSLEVIEQLRALGARTVVTGHGPVAGPEVFDVSVDYLRWVQQLAADGIAAGLTPLQVAAETELGRFADLLDSERLVPNLHRAYAEAQGAAPGDPLDIGALFGEMIEHHGGLPRCRA
ncbi:MBL fold metallo-hydrolase [Streptomyces tateyamensis]|uniref:MBL fold metallo-hydrolase n=1 Tax=Streptomyces tateyamensis TaxID=565073 RepID=A0A2V4PIV1_9ACTN|nr:MBL fold metallo-hydrolase [Streptomyces tateyamensis]